MMRTGNCKLRIANCKLQIVSPRFAFTLLEVLVALAISLILIAAVYQSLHLYYRYSTAGQAEVAQAQLARALLNRIALDIRSVIYQEPQPAQGTGDAAAGDAAAADGDAAAADADAAAATEVVVIEDPMEAYTTTTTGLFGSANTLLLHASKPSRDLNYSLVGAPGTVPRTSDLVTVSYYVAAPTAGSPGGLARLEGDRLSISLASQSGDANAMLQSTQILAEEVVAIRFLYFDGYDPTLQLWDSLAYGGLPRSVRVEIDLIAPPETVGLGKVVSTGGVQTFYIVVALPLAKPLVSTTTTTTQ